MLNKRQFIVSEFKENINHIMHAVSLKIHTLGQPWEGKSKLPGLTPMGETCEYRRIDTLRIEHDYNKKRRGGRWLLRKISR